MRLVKLLLGLIVSVLFLSACTPRLGLAPVSSATPIDAAQITAAIASTQNIASPPQITDQPPQVSDVSTATGRAKPPKITVEPISYSDSSASRANKAPKNNPQTISKNAVAPKLVKTDSKSVAKKSAIKPVAKTESKAISAQVTVKPNSAGWTWPVRGKIAQAYSAKSAGIDISGRLGQAIVAASDGEVVYAGQGINGYGNLVIIKRNKVYLSAYAHCQDIFVKEGDVVKAGQKIATIGHAENNQTTLHFEIRKYGKPVNPIGLLS